MLAHYLSEFAPLQTFLFFNNKSYGWCHYQKEIRGKKQCFASKPTQRKNARGKFISYFTHIRMMISFR
jgi:hypothetical protein